MLTVGRPRVDRRTGAGQPMGWEALEQWGDDVARIAPLAGGVANDVWSVRVNGHRAVGRLGTRSDADLAWETALLQYLDREGLTVPVPLPTTDGRLFADGLVVITYVAGGPPETEADWQRVAATLRQLHRLTQGWPQRPGWRSSTDLLHAATGTTIDLGAMPRHRCASVGRMGSRRLLGRRVRSQAARRRSSGLSSGSESRDRTECRIFRYSAWRPPDPSAVMGALRARCRSRRRSHYRYPT